MIDATTGVHCGAVAWPLAARARRAFRRSELVALDVADLEETEDGFKIIIRRSEANVALCVAAQIVPMMVATIPHSHLRDFLDQRVTDGVIRLNNLRILSLSFDGFVSRYAGMPFPKETLAFSDEPNKLMAVMERTDYRVWQDWKQFSVPGATVIAQSSFWLENCTNEETFEMYINGTTIPRYRRTPRIRKREDLNQFVRTHLISNVTGEFRYHTDPRRRIRFGRAKDNTDWHFMRSLYVLFMQEVMPLIPKKVIDPDGTRRGTIQLAMLWLEKAVQMMLRVQQLGTPDNGNFTLMVDELQRVYRAWEELCANTLGQWAGDGSADPLTG